MAQGVLPFQYQEQSTAAGLIALAGLPAYLDLAQASGLRHAIREHLTIRGQGSRDWTDSHGVDPAASGRW
jgi:hypothetical protein